MADVRLRILVVDDEPGIREQLSDLFARIGHAAQSAATGELALAALAERPVDVAIVDLNLGGGMDGIELLKRARADHPDLTVVLISARASIAKAVEATKL